MVVPASVMLWIGLFIPILSFIVGYGLQVWIQRAWVGTIVVFALSFISLILWFRLRFWPWLLLYVMLDWLGAWVGANVMKRRATKGNLVKERKATD